MSRIGFFRYTDEQWNDIKTVVRNGLRLDADEIMSWYGAAMVEIPLRDRIEIAAGDHIFYSLMRGGRPGYMQLRRLRSRAIALDDEVSLSSRSVSAVTTPSTKRTASSPGWCAT